MIVKENISQLFLKFISMVIEKQNDELKIIQIFLEQIQSKQPEFFKLFYINQQNYVKIQDIQISNKFDNINETYYKNPSLIETNKYDGKSQNQLNDKSSLNQSKNFKSHLQYPDLYFYTKQNNNFNFVNKQKIYNFNILSIHRDINQNVVKNLIYPEFLQYDMKQNQFNFLNSNNSNKNLIINITLMTLVFLTNTQQILVNEIDKINNIQYQNDINQIVNSGQRKKLIKIGKTLINTYQFKIFSKNQNIIFHKVLINLIKHSNIIQDERCQETSLSLNTIFKIIEVPLDNCLVYSIALKDTEKFRLFLMQNACNESIVKNFLQLYHDFPLSIQVQIPLFNYFKQINNLRIDINKFYKLDKELLQEHILENQVSRQNQSKNPNEFRDIISYKQYFELNEKTIYLTQKESEYTDPLLRFLNHVQKSDLIQSIDKEEILKIKNKFQESLCLNYQISNKEKQGEIYKRIFGKCKIFKIFFQNDINKRNYITDIDDKQFMKILRIEFTEMKNTNKLFMPSSFLIIHDHTQNTCIKLIGGFKKQRKSDVKLSSKNFHHLIHYFYVTEIQSVINFHKLFKIFQKNAQKSNQFTKEEMLEIKLLIKSVEHINDSFKSNVIWQEAQDIYGILVKRKTIYNKNNNKLQELKMN